MKFHENSSGGTRVVSCRQKKWTCRDLKSAFALRRRLERKFLNRCLILFKILIVYSIAYSESFGQDNAHNEETTCPHTFNCHYMIYDFHYGMKQINSLERDLLCSVRLWSLLLSMKRKLIQPLGSSSYIFIVLMQCKV